MPIKNQEFYEGAALHLLARSGRIAGIRYEPPLFILNEELIIHLKHSKRTRSPWGFTFSPDEQKLLNRKCAESKLTIGLTCGADGIAALTFEDYITIAALRNTAIHVSCYRLHGKHYEVSGPDGILKKKISPSNWQRILEETRK